MPGGNRPLEIPIDLEHLEPRIPFLFKNVRRATRSSFASPNTVARYYNTDAFSDVAITCDGQEFKAHRVILSAHSKYFTKALNGEWKESSERQLDIKDFDASVVEAMLRFMYSFDYSNIYGTSTMAFDAQMYQIADKYDIPALKAQSKNKFEVAVTTGWSMDAFPLTITVVYESTPPEDRGLRDLVVETARENIDELLRHDGFCELIRKTPDFAADLIPFLSMRPSGSIYRYRCPSCHHKFRGEFSGVNYCCPNCSSKRSDWDSHRIKD
ncbi:BTB/POZ protein [Fusarium avenaceum]|nr:BTB/POZ protein [Fusarium avenaceum]